MKFIGRHRYKGIKTIPRWTFLWIAFLTQALSAQVDFIWGTQFGSEKDDKTRNLIVDALGNVYLVGKTKGIIGENHYGKNDGFVVKIDANGNTRWSRQIGSTGDDEFKHLIADPSGDLYVTGYTQTKNGDKDILVVKLNESGDILWERQYGSDHDEEGANIIVDANGALFITGHTTGIMGETPKGGMDAYLLQLDSEGNTQKVVQFGTKADEGCQGITLGPDGNIYVCGETKGSLSSENAGKWDVFWVVFSPNFELLDSHQFGTAENDYASEIKTNRYHHVYTAGGTNGEFNIQSQGNNDALLLKWDQDGNILWARQFGTERWDGIHSIAVAENQGVLVSGCLDYPYCKSFIRMYSEEGELLWENNRTGQGENGGCCGKDICLSQNGDLYHAGYTGTHLFSKLQGEHDLFLVKLNVN